MARVDCDVFMENDDGVEARGSETEHSNGPYGYVVIAEHVTIWPGSAANCDQLIAAFTEAKQRFGHARPLGVPDVDAPAEEEPYD